MDVTSAAMVRNHIKLVGVTTCSHTFYKWLKLFLLEDRCCFGNYVLFVSQNGQRMWLSGFLSLSAAICKQHSEGGDSITVEVVILCVSHFCLSTVHGISM